MQATKNFALFLLVLVLFSLTCKVDQGFCSLSILTGKSQVLPSFCHDNINFSTKSNLDLV